MDKHTDMNDHYTSLCATPTRGNKHTDMNDNYTSLYATPMRGNNCVLYQKACSTSLYIKTVIGEAHTVENASYAAVKVVIGTKPGLAAAGSGSGDRH